MTMTAPRFTVGSLVAARGREWVVLPNDDPELLMLRPLGGADADACGVYLPLEGHDVRPATFAAPDPAAAGDHTSARLLRDAARLSIRAGAGPFRAFGRIACEPRTYQLVPLLMALRLDPVRLLIADDVGIGKTIESALIARELLDRGEIQRICVVCPAHLCEQWAAELRDKFHVEAAIIRPGSVAKLERGLTTAESVFDAEHNQHLIVSVDYIKADRRRADFVRNCPELVIVDEAHTCAASASGRSSQQQRHRLIKELAEDRTRHLILATATPHSGVDDAFRSLIGLLDPVLADLPDDPAADDPIRVRLAGHLVQRRRGDIQDYLDQETVFPRRVPAEKSYLFTPEYRRLFESVRAYARELVADKEGDKFAQRVRWWAALAMLRCVVSSPAAAAATLRSRVARPSGDNAELSVRMLDDLGKRTVFDEETDAVDERDDLVPGADAVEEGSPEAAERRRLLDLARQADALAGVAKDAKLRDAVAILVQLLDDGFTPIVFCRYLATADYLEQHLRKIMPDVAIEAVTGRLPADERSARVDDLGGREGRRVLVATDCLSEGVNLQEHFDAVVHYDLAWNPTRHEQREGRVDRFGQSAPEVRTVLLYGGDNSVDGAVLDVLLRKAERIRKRLGVSIPVPVDSSVLEAIFESILGRSGNPQQLSLDLDEAQGRISSFGVDWDRVAEQQYRRSRTIFAQERLRPEEIRVELNAALGALGGADDVGRFVRDASGRLGASCRPAADRTFLLNAAELPEAVRERSGLDRPTRITFDYPAPTGTTSVGRTSPLVEGLADALTGAALAGELGGVVSRSGAIRTAAVVIRTTVALLRVRMHLDVTRRGETTQLLAEECIAVAWQGSGEDRRWLSPPMAEELLFAEPAANTTSEQRTRWLAQALDDLDREQAEIERIARVRADAALDAHRRVRRAAGITGASERITPVLPADVLGLYVLMPSGGAG